MQNPGLSSISLLISLFLTITAYSQKPTISSDGNSLSMGPYTIFRDIRPHRTPSGNISAEILLDLLNTWRPEERITHVIDEDSTAELNFNALTSSGNDISLGYGVMFGSSGTYRNVILNSADFGESWADTIIYETPGTLQSYLGDLALSHDSIFIVGSASRFDNNRYSPFYRKKIGFSGSWSQPFYFLIDDIYLLKWPTITKNANTLHFAFYQPYSVGEPWTIIDSLYYYRGNINNDFWAQGNPLTYCPGLTNAPLSIVSCASNISIIFEDNIGNSHGQWSLEIIQLLSTDGGNTWERRELTPFDSLHSYNPAAFSDGESKIIVTWADYKYGSGPSGFTGNILSLISIDGGLTWGNEQRITEEPTADLSAPFIAGNLFGIAWEDHRLGQFSSDLYYAESTNEGSDWSQIVRLTNAPNFKFRLKFVVRDQRVILFWEDSRDGNNFQYEIYMKMYDIDTGTDERPNIIPRMSSISAYPNPFNSNTTISLNYNDTAPISIYDITGRLITILHAEKGKAVWEAKGIASGIYFALAQKEDISKGIKLVLLK
jgi:hypothetical protein